MIEIRYACANCQRGVCVELTSDAAIAKCPACGDERSVDPQVVKAGRLTGCAFCHGELYLRKDFPQRLGVTIVVVGFAISIATWYYYWIYATYAVLFGVALLDALLYLLVGNMLQCYRCQAQYRGVPGLADHSPFNLETHERYRQQAARLPKSASSPQT